MNTDKVKDIKNIFHTTNKVKLEDTKKSEQRKTTKIATPTVINKSDMAEIKVKPKTKRKDHNGIKIFFKILALLILVLAAARVPYAGSYIDGLFDYLFGQTKYVFYLWGIITCIILLYNGRIARIVKTRKYWVFSLISILAIGCIISGSVDLSKYFGQHPTFVDRMNDYHNSWYNYFMSTSYSSYFNTYISGGIIAVLLSFLFNFVSYAVLIVFAAILLLICIFILFNINYKSTRIGLRLRGWIIRKLGGSFRYDSYNELSAEGENQNKISKSSKSEIEQSASQTDEINFNLLPSSDINNDNKNWKKAATNQAKLANLFKRQDINCVSGDINIYTSYSELCFEAKNATEVKKIIKIQDLISQELKLDKFNITCRGNILSIDYDNLYFSKMSLKSVSTMFKRKPLTSFFGIDKAKKIVTHNYKLSPTSLIVGKKGSGAATLTVLMALTACYCTKPDMLDLVILNANCEQTYIDFRNLPHTAGKSYETINAVSDKLHELQSIVNQRTSLLTLNNVDNIDQFNKISNDSTSQMKYILVVIPNFESTIKETFQNSKIIEELLVSGPKVGLYTILQSYSVNNEVMDQGIYSNTSDKYIFALEDRRQSERIFGNDKGFVLHGNGDCLHFYKDKIKTMERIQVCNINRSELTADIEIAKTFYTIKQEQAQAVVLEEKPNEEQQQII